MAELKDSGARRDFETGAVRDIADGKGRCDLLPLTVVSELFHSDPILGDVEQYIRSGDLDCLRFAILTFSNQHFVNLATAMLEVAKQYEDGCQKYGERNWEKGMPVHFYIDSGVRHYLKFRRGDVDEPHDRAFLWNLLGAIWTHENKPELIDLPFANKDKSDIGNPAADKPETERDKRNDVDDVSLRNNLCIKYGDAPCNECPIGPCKNGKGLSCNELVRNYPNTFRCIALKYLEARE